MDYQSTALFLESLLERIVIDKQTGKNHLRGFISSHEISALKNAISILKSNTIADHEDISLTSDEKEGDVLKGEDEVETSDDLSKENQTDIKLNLSSLSMDENQHEDIIMCLDFGTAMSKAFATKFEGEDVVDNFKLMIGSRVSKSGMIYTVPSSIWISNDGVISFGENAIVSSLQNSNGTRQRFDSPKKELIQGLVETTLDKVALTPEINPTDTPFSKGDAITIYLAYLTDLACSEINEKYDVSRHIRRRFALPSWEEERRSWGESTLSIMLAKAQILADTFHDKWQDGIYIDDIKSALDKINMMDKLPTHLIDIGVTEPLAAASSRLRKEEQTRGLVMVIDIGAGTSDFGMFVVSEDPNRSIFRAWPILGCDKSLHQAGDTLDIALQQAILEKARIDSSNPDYEYIVANLRFRIRTLKEEIFSEGQCSFTLSNGERGTIDINEFLDRPSVKRFGELLEKSFEDVLNCTDISFIKRFDGEKLTVILTGGGANLPMVTELSQGSFGRGGYQLRKSKAPLVPDEFSNDSELSYVYPQLAVAIGGSQPDLIKESKALEKMPGIVSADWEIGRY